jgi:chemotaxis protein CheD
VKSDFNRHRNIGIGEMLVSGNAEDILITYSLGSCVGVSLYDPEIKLGGLIHCQLPMSTSNPEQAKSKPSLYVDTGVVNLLQEMYNRGAIKSRLICKVAGAGSPLAIEQEQFRIGEKNLAVLKKVLWKNGILIKAEMIGGDTAKTMILDIGNGKTLLRVNAREEVEL